MGPGHAAGDAVLLSLAGPVEEVGPLGAGFFTADPEGGRYPDHQRHQVLHQKQGEVGPLVLLSLEQRDINKLSHSCELVCELTKVTLQVIYMTELL